MDLWQETIQSLQRSIPTWEFSQWLAPVRCDFINQARGELVLSVPDESHGKWVEDTYSESIREVLKTLTSADFQIQFRLYGASELTAQGREPRDLSGPPPLLAVMEERSKSERAVLQANKPSLLPHYRFDTFVDGPTNQFAMSAARAVADFPGQRYNPLFIFGGVGLGKTHLLHAIGHEVLQRDPKTRVRYVTSELFVNELIKAIRTDQMHEFRAAYRDSCDVLLVDDIQFIAGKDRTQEEFFHLFNTLHSYGKQIVMTCDQLPQSIPDMEDRLKSRLQWGLIADIKPPGFETRVAILKAKAESEGIELPDDVAMLMARHVTRNVRELEGALRQLLANAKMLSRPLEVSLVHDALGNILGERLAKIAPDTILKSVASEFKVSLSELKGPRRHRTITVPRQMAMYLIRELTDESLPQIGALFGGRDHSTVINSLKRVEALRDANPEVRAQLDRIRRTLRD